MSKCSMTKNEDWAAFLLGDLEDKRRTRLAGHIEGCPACRAEVEAVKRILDEAAAGRAEVREALASVDWAALPAVIADRAFAEARKPESVRSAEPIRGVSWLFRLKPALAGLVAGLAVGAAAMYLALRAPGPRPDGRGGYFASQDFLDRAELEMARRSTLDYLRKSQYLLLDVFESHADGAAAFRPERTKDLLARKKYLNAQLEKVQMAKAKAICDQIEMLFLELAAVSETLTEADLERIRGFVEERQLLLKINLVSRELESEI